MTKVKKSANYCVQTDVLVSCFVRVVCAACGTVLNITEPDGNTVQHQPAKNNAVILTVSVPPFCPKCLKAKRTRTTNASGNSMQARTRDLP